MDASELGEKCDHDPCHCVPNSDGAVVREKSVYCSQGCADGKGCDHEGCACTAG